ncbi:CAF17-like 4Fe-4S cluster assembly/insertion protein YgfZ [Woeseia oceani]|uniref:Aminomethyltransferase folate-binding domain-containing protein n=1 Tax=Woeseia oceani TaxID=1548547 RepID=A0A193LF60_9GAMM|nr:folate-binding protein YgfZ [Woeseia oceani]ANO51103.1 hypothetical protein BA177_07720 [Woeseia oceani]
MAQLVSDIYLLARAMAACARLHRRTGMYTQILASGDDAIGFLQGQLTQDLNDLSAEFSPLAAWCNPKGRVVAVLRLLALENGVGLILPDALAEPVITGLLRYRLRAQVELLPAGAQWRAYALSAGQDLAALESMGLLPEPAANASRRRAGITAVSLDTQRSVVELYADVAALDTARLKFAAPLSAGSWAAARIQAGITDIDDTTTEQYTPHMLNLDRLGAISFFKGCYPGQEIVARTEHLGSVKRSVARYRAHGTPVASGEPVQFAGVESGVVVASAGSWLLAMVPTELHDKTLSCAGQEITPPDQTSGRI